jgi:hypothetical protein
MVFGWMADHAAFKVDFLENGFLIFLKLHILVAHVQDYCLAKNKKIYDPFGRALQTKRLLGIWR